MEHLIVVSQKNQANRFLRFLELDQTAEAKRTKFVGNSEILFLDWGDPSKKISKPIRQLSKALDNAQITRVAIPRSAHVITKARYRDFSNIYSNYLNASENIREAFLFSYEGHYALLCQMLKDSQVKLNIIEDGLGMYVHGMENHRVKVTGFVLTIKHATMRLVGSVLNTDSTVPLSRKVIRWMREIYWGLFGSAIPNKELLTNGFRNFDDSYSSFPELAQKLFPNSFQHFVPFAEAMLDDSLEVSDIKKAVPFEEGDCLFLAQTYVFGEHELRRLIKTSLKLSPNNIWIKLHPRTDKELKKQFYKAAEQIDSNRIKFCGFSAPAENLIAALEPRKVISLTSTSLTYVKQLSSSSEPVSLADFALYLLDGSSERSARRTRVTLSADRAVLRYFPEVTMYMRKKKK